MSAAPPWSGASTLLETLVAQLKPATDTPAAALEPEEEDRLLTPDEAARLLGVSKRWLYRHSKRLPFARKLSRKVLRFSLRGLRRWQERQKP